MITLHQYPQAFNLSSLSPFCIKVEFYLKVAKIPYQVQFERNPARGPKSKMPFIVDRGLTIADSSFILEHLMREELQITDPVAEAQALAFKTMIEEGLYFILLYSRWIDSTGYKIIQNEFIPLFPPLIGRPFLSLIRRNLIRQARAQGLGRHSSDEVYALGKKQIAALATFLGDNKFFFQNKLTYFDATSFAFLNTILSQPIESPLKISLRSHSNLCAYVKRMEELC